MKIERSNKKQSFRNFTPASIAGELLEKGKVTPQAVEVEMSVLGAVLIDSDCFTEVINILHADAFYKIEHQEIYRVFLKLFEKSRPIDLITVNAELRESGRLDDIGGTFYLTELTNQVASTANVQHYARIIAEKFIQREIIRLSSTTIQNAYAEDVDVFELLDKAEHALFQLTENNISKAVEGMDILVTKAIREIELLKDQEDGVTGVPSGLIDLDKVTSGWQKSDLIIIAARPAMGKTAFTLSIARNAAVDHKKAVAVFSLEMSGVQLVNRLISGEAELENDKLRKGNLQPYEWKQLTTRVSSLEEAPLFIDDTPAISIFELRAKCRRLKMQHDIQMVVIDYLQLMTAGGPDAKSGNREQEISLISRSLKVIAKELEIPILALSQLSRQVEARPDKRPMLSDLRESGAIEQDADIVIFLYRAEYYNLQLQDGSPSEGMGEIIIAKHRNGELANVMTRFVGKFAKFTNIQNTGSNGIGIGGDNQTTITLGSKANSHADDDLPF